MVKHVTHHQLVRQTNSHVNSVIPDVYHYNGVVMELWSVLTMMMKWIARNVVLVNSGAEQGNALTIIRFVMASLNVVIVRMSRSAVQMTNLCVMLE